MPRVPNIFLLLGGIIMVLAIIYVLVFGNFLDEARVLFPLPWFQLTLIDLYLGFFLFGGWILFREESRAKAVGWIVVICVLGNLAACIYALKALVQSRGNWTAFWLGHRQATMQGS